MLTGWIGFYPICLVPVMALVLLGAFCIDHYWGEPPVAVHPVVWMGRYLQICGNFTVRRPPAGAFLLGALAWWLGAGFVGGIAWGLQSLLVGWWARQAAFGAGVTGWLAALSIALTLAWLLKSMLSWRMLHDEVGAVEAALGQSLDTGRKRLARLVSRDTAKLTEGEVRESAIETLAENLSDSVVAPLFWFVLFGLPGAAVYRFANTADAMWGYRGLRHGVNWEWAGKWAAWADDALSWLPARLTAWLLMGLAGQFQFGRLRREAAKTPSPNSGWPMAAMALALGVALSKTGVYTLNPTGRAPQASDLLLAQKYASKVVFTLIPCAWVAIIYIALVI